MGIIKKAIINVFKKMERDISRARRYALNRAARAARKAAIDFIRSKYNIKAKDLRDVIKITTATMSKQLVKISIKDEPIGLIKYSSRQSARPKRYNTGRVGGTKVTVKKGNRKLRKHAFIATMPSGHEGVYIRTGETTSTGKERIQELFGPSAMSLFSIDDVQKVLENKFYERIDIEFERRMKYYENKK